MGSCKPAMNISARLVSSAVLTRQPVCQEYGKTVRINEVPVPEITENEILVKIASASLCHSDLMLLNGEFEGPGRPVTLGHEGVGYVEKLGANVKGFKPGDRIGFLYIKGCCCKPLLLFLLPFIAPNAVSLLTTDKYKQLNAAAAKSTT